MVLCALCIILALLFLKVALDFRRFILFYSNSFISEILIWDIQRSHFDFALSMSCIPIPVSNDDGSHTRNLAPASRVNNCS